MGLTQERLKELLHYDPETGVFTWKTRLSNRGVVGNRAGAPSSGYNVIRIEGRNYRGARLAWLYMTGALPDIHIDHIDLNKANDAWSNLRLATRSENMANVAVRKHSKSGIKGVYKKGNRWIAYIRNNGVKTHLGSFDCPAAASLAFQIAASAAYGEFARASWNPTQKAA